MKKTKALLFVLVLLIAVLLSACGGGEQTEDTSGGSTLLTVAGQTFTTADLEGMDQVQASFKDVTYVGVPVAELLSEVGYDLASLKAVKGIASDGYTINYEPELLMADNVIVSYATVDGPLSTDDGDFRMVLPDAEGKMNLRMLAELQIVE